MLKASPGNIMRLKKEIEEDTICGSIYNVHGWEELTLLKCPLYPRKSVDSTQFLPRHQGDISQSDNKYSKNLYGTTKDPA